MRDEMNGTGTLPRAASRAEVEALLPHRAPFLFVDSVEVEGGELIVGEHRFDPGEWFFKGHFPHMPVVPGVLLLETMAQCGGAGVKLMGVEPRGTFLLAGMSDIKFKRPVMPGEVFRMEIDTLRATANMVKQAGRGYVGDELAVEASWIALSGGDR